MTAAPRPRPRPAALGAGVAALAACALCCAGPLLALLGGLGVASVVAAVFIPALAVVAVAAAGGVVWALRRRRAAACRVPAASGVVELGMPAPPSASRHSQPRPHVGSADKDDQRGPAAP